MTTIFSRLELRVTFRTIGLQTPDNTNIAIELKSALPLEDPFFIEISLIDNVKADTNVSIIHIQFLIVLFLDS